MRVSIYYLYQCQVQFLYKNIESVYTQGLKLQQILGTLGPGGLVSWAFLEISHRCKLSLALLLLTLAHISTSPTHSLMSVGEPGQWWPVAAGKIMFSEECFCFLSSDLSNVFSGLEHRPAPWNGWVSCLSKSTAARETWLERDGGRGGRRESMMVGTPQSPIHSHPSPPYQSTGPSTPGSVGTSPLCNLRCDICQKQTYDQPLTCRLSGRRSSQFCTQTRNAWSLGDWQSGNPTTPRSEGTRSEPGQNLIKSKCRIHICRILLLTSSLFKSVSSLNITIQKSSLFKVQLTWIVFPVCSMTPSRITTISYLMMHTFFWCWSLT